MENDHQVDWLKGNEADFFFGITLAFINTITPPTKHLLSNVAVSLLLSTEEWREEYKMVRVATRRSLAKLYAN